MSDNSNFSIMVHGGAGTFKNVTDNESASLYLDAIRNVLEKGREILKSGGSALDAVEVCASILEDDPLFNAGRGSVLNEFGKVEMDAAIMDGRDLSAGAVLARRVMIESEHVLLIGEGALRFAEQKKVRTVGDDYFISSDRIAQLEAARNQNRMLLDYDESTGENGDPKYGTIGAIALDMQGNLAAATSTGGIVNKRQGRVGDSPIVGAGVYADNETCAVSATGYGEDFMRTVISKTISDFILMKNMDAEQATIAGIEYLTRKVKGRGGVIVIDKNGNCASGLTTSKMVHGWIENGKEAIVRF